jgi:hypothetical protein
LWSIEKSFHRSVVTRRDHVERWGKQNIEMKTKRSATNSKRILRNIFRRRPRVHDPMLVLNMSLFNFTDGWSRVFSRDLYGRFSA